MPDFAQDPSDALLQGHDPTPGIVSVWVDAVDRALVWRRTPGGVVLEYDRFRPWVYARDLRDLTHLGERLHGAPDGPIHARELPGEPGSLRHLITASDSRRLRQAILQGASVRQGERASSLHDLSGYYSVGLAEGYLMSSGRAYFKGTGH